MARLIVEATTNEYINGFFTAGYMNILVSVSDDAGDGVTGLAAGNFRISTISLEVGNPDFGGLTLSVTERKWENDSSLSGFYDVTLSKPSPDKGVYGGKAYPTAMNISFGIEVIRTQGGRAGAGLITVGRGRTLITITNV